MQMVRTKIELDWLICWVINWVAFIQFCLITGQTGYIPVAYVELIEAESAVAQNYESTSAIETQWEASSYAYVSESQATEGDAEVPQVNEYDETSNEHENQVTIERPSVEEGNQIVPSANDKADGEYATALYDYVAASEEEISFHEGKLLIDFDCC